MSKFSITERVPCYVDFFYEVEAESEDDARRKFKRGECEVSDEQPRIMDGIDYLPSEIVEIEA